jgi:hypothetical protein
MSYLCSTKVNQIHRYSRLWFVLTVVVYDQDPTMALQSCEPV